MPRTREQLDRAATEVEAWLETLDPVDHPAEDTSDLRAIAVAVTDIAEGERRLRSAVATARANGRSWGRISMALGVTRQAARERFGERTDA